VLKFYVIAIHEGDLFNTHGRLSEFPHSKFF
jgi:hypothetical protein